MHFHADVNDESQSLVALVVHKLIIILKSIKSLKKLGGIPGMFRVFQLGIMSGLVRCSDWIFNGHFPKRPKFVGRWMVRAKLTQSAGLI